jgi:hypothetical protein
MPILPFFSSHTGCFILVDIEKSTSSDQFTAKITLAVSSTEYCGCLFDEGDIMGKYQ